MDAKNNNKVQGSVIAIGVIGLILGFFIGWFIGKGNAIPQTELVVDNTDMSEETDATPTEEQTGDVRNPIQENQSGTNILEVNTTDATFKAEDQKAGMTAMVQGVSVSKVTWVAIRDNNAGKLGNILGARRIEAGNNQNVKVELARATEAGKEYFAVLFEDNGDKVFNHKVDLQVVKDGEVLASGFKAE